ncbi:hypothetical protein [Larsenimonas suaedae]|uniref:Lipoprotein n=1 Tax=Larsenimonas suaedae TaxID=1851019 RepID=A0ABU1GSP9_9GAMM|nr:hypothetical protein [Larsenimonas suaedae]MCM2972153.1 hypothetical protein [Larsenimonas suaedae]MDR5895051.1 hypothetical protein [Larsenimonas suaedae]
MNVRSWPFCALLLLLMTGCAGVSSTPPAPVVVATTASPLQTQTALTGVLVERGFTIDHADHDLCTLSAHFAARPPFHVEGECRPGAPGTRLELRARRGTTWLAGTRLTGLVEALAQKLPGARAVTAP